MALKNISNVTGLEKDSIKYRVQALYEQNFIRVLVKGGYSKILGGRIRSTYVLNAQHPLLADAIGLPQCLDMSKFRAPALGTTYWPWTHAEHIELLRQNKKEPWIFTASAFLRYHWVLHCTEGETFFRHLPLYLARYAVLVLAEKGIAEAKKAFKNCDLLHQEVLRDFHLPRQSDGALWNQLVKKFRILEGEHEPVMEIAVESESNEAGAVKEVVKDFVDLKTVIVTFVLTILRRLEDLSAKLSSVDWRRSRLVWLANIEGDEGFIVLQSPR